MSSLDGGGDDDSNGLVMGDCMPEVVVGPMKFGEGLRCAAVRALGAEETSSLRRSTQAENPRIEAYGQKPERLLT